MLRFSSRYFRSSKALRFVLCFAVCCEVISTEINADKSEDESKNVNVSVKTINGRIYVNWIASDVWQNTTVYFWSSSHGNASHPVTISVCSAVKFDQERWQIKALNGNLLKFCHESSRCQVRKGVTSLINAMVISKKTQELSCQLFTTCTNFDGVYRVQVVFIGQGREHRFESRNMTIHSENIPPFFEGEEGAVQHGVNIGVSIKIKYYEPSELCGFGANPSDNLQFVIKYYKLHDIKCSYLGQKTIQVHSNVTSVSFDEIMRSTEIMYFDFTVKSLINNKTSPWKRYTIETTDKVHRCTSTRGVLTISWRPRWSCFGENIVEQAQFCFEDNDSKCLPVCEVSFFANGTLRAAKTYDDFLSACKESQGCKVYPQRRDIEMFSVSWSRETQRITCELFRTCVDYVRPFSVKAFSWNDKRMMMSNPLDMCNSHRRLQALNDPSVPQDVRAVNVTEDKVTITWKSNMCEIEHYDVEVYLVIDDQQIKFPESSKPDLSPDGFNYIYKYTKKDLVPYSRVTYRVFTQSDYDLNNRKESEHSPLKEVRTKPADPEAATLTNVEDVGGGRVRLTWTFPEEPYVRGQPNETWILGKVNSASVYKKSVFGVNRISAVIYVNATQRCAFYQVKICNAPHLCSDYSNRLRTLKCEKGHNTTPTTADSSSSNMVWMIVVAVSIISIVIIASLAMCFYFRRKRQGKPKLPALEVEKDQSGDYIPVGQLSHPGEYETLDKEDCLETLVT